MVAAIVVVAVAVVLIASGGDESPPPVKGTAAEAVAVVEAFQRALGARDFATICDRLFTRRARDAAGGDNCQSVLAQAATRLHTPTVQIRSVLLSRGGKATVGVVAGTSGERPAADVIHLVRQGGRFRIASAGDPAAPGD
ncbi:MAG: hypothetical protein QOG41_940 [Thermoleophilaceae bacterium]|nr:hypothetical protein [Thermoleophilaceae bacterium]MEA2350458.1 hypothetical protein [Thermoleophilaceae bacterium]MEA2388167.1 hypothetical protein [Thermoleophilaceae bacterium]